MILFLLQIIQFLIFNFQMYVMLDAIKDIR
jgi:hypothetical protein